jgi:hypothetical protein
MPNIIVDANYIIIEGVRIERPSRIAPSHWLAYWETRVLPTQAS